MISDTDLPKLTLGDKARIQSAIDSGIQFAIVDESGCIRAVIGLSTEKHLPEEPYPTELLDVWQPPYKIGTMNEKLRRRDKICRRLE